MIRGVVFLEESSLVVFYYLSASEIWPDKRGGLSRGEQFSSILLSHYAPRKQSLHICGTLPADVHEGIWLLSKI